MATATKRRAERSRSRRKPPARNEVARARVAEIQRGRMIAAMVEVAAERSAANVSVAHVVARSGVSRRTFYEIFEDREDCFLAAFDDEAARAGREVQVAYRVPRNWRERIRAALIAALSFLEREPDAARLLVVEALGAGPKVLERRAQIIARLVEAVDEGREELGANGDGGPTLMTAEGVVGGVLALAHRRLLEGDSGRLMELVSPAMSMIVLPYLGARAAAEELRRAAPKGICRPRETVDPLRELEMRLTYRTVRVLMSVAASPGSSNRTIGEGAGIADQGQISKLLARLRTLCLIENGSRGLARGEPNAWTLTAKGWEIHGAITRQMAA